jgi:putative peptidoglycan lipid II flippase
MAWVVAFVLLAKLASMAKEVAIAYRYGTSELVDAYLFAFSLATWPVAVWFSILTAVFIPIAAKLQNRADESLKVFQAELLGFTLILGGVLAMAFWFGMPFMLRHSILRLDGLQFPLVLEMTTPFALLLPLGLLISLFSAWVLSEGRQWNTVLEGIPALTIFIFVVLSPLTPASALIFGTLVGAAAHLASLAVARTRQSGFIAPAFGFASPAWPGFWTGIGVMAIGQVFISFTGIIDQFFAADLHSGAVATLGYANRLLSLVLSLGATAIARGIFPVLAVAHARNSPNLSAVVARWTAFLFIVGVVAASIGWPLASWAVELLFQRGAFTSSDTEAVAKAVQFGLVQVPIYFCGMVFVQFFASRRDYYVLVVSGLLAVATKLIANYLLAQRLGVPGITLASSIMFGANVLLFIAFFRGVRDGTKR